MKYNVATLNFCPKPTTEEDKNSSYTDHFLHIFKHSQLLKKRWYKVDEKAKHHFWEKENRVNKTTQVSRHPLLLTWYSNSKKFGMTVMQEKRLIATALKKPVCDHRWRWGWHIEINLRKFSTNIFTLRKLKRTFWIF